MMDIYRYYAVLHSELVPYIFSWSVESHLTGEPMVKNSDIAAASHMLGTAIFSSPVVTDGVAVGKALTLPEAGRWIDYWNEDTILEGGTQLTVQVPLDRIPVYLRAGAIIPMNGPATSRVTATPPRRTAKRCSSIHSENHPSSTIARTGRGSNTTMSASRWTKVRAS